MAVSIGAIRRLVIGSQGYTGRFRRAGTGDVEATIRRLSAVQLDSISTVERAHRLTLTARIGAYPRDTVPALLRTGRVFEYWAHEASLIPIELHPLFRWRMADVQREAWGSIARIPVENPRLVAETLRLVGERGPIRARDTGAVRP
ncbi:MAG TPA: crosslink repair DNA glycosylase YcaQ family protein, partial [Gaiellaceae bacterium]|nr:crosslink repair DNA glycosylase YcaQ family protein [Gaiellaceae bacterium]